jgi:gluconate 5-dehydrogenase
MTRTLQQLFGLKGKTALVTGGAGGQGLQMAQALGEAGARIMLAGPVADELEQACAQLQAAGIDARWVATDCLEPAGMAHLVSETLQRMGDVDILVNHACADPKLDAQAHHAVEAWNAALNEQLRGYVALSQRVVEASMLGRRFGRIINVASVAGSDGNFLGTSAAARRAWKDAVINCTHALSAQWAGEGITVNAICPDLSAAANPARDTPAAPGAAPQLGGEASLKGACVLFASAAGQHITGQWLAVSGG